MFLYTNWSTVKFWLKDIKAIYVECGCISDNFDIPHFKISKNQLRNVFVDLKDDDWVYCKKEDDILYVTTPNFTKS